MTFNDIFKSGFLDSIGAVSLGEMGITLLLSFALGLFIFLVYKKTYRGVMYSSSFAVTLVAMTMICAMLIMAVTSNVVLSLGMVGALSIVRFRAAIKEPLDIAFLFWAIAAGIVLAAGMIPLAVIGSVVIGIVLMVFVNRKSHSEPFIAVIRCADAGAEERASALLRESCRRCVLKSKSVRKGEIELSFELRLKDGRSDFVNAISDSEGVFSAVLVSYNGDYMG